MKNVINQNFKTNIMKNIIYSSIILLVFILLSSSSCKQQPKSTADRDIQNKTELAMKEANRQVGMPAIVNYQEKKNLKWSYNFV